MVEDIQGRGESLKRQIRVYLKQRHAANATVMAQTLGVTPFRLRRVLRSMVHSGQVRELKPVGSKLRNEILKVPSSRQSDSAYYRLIQPADERYVWQQQINTCIVKHRIYDLCSTELPNRNLTVA